MCHLAVEYSILSAYGSRRESRCDSGTAEDSSWTISGGVLEEGLASIRINCLNIIWHNSDTRTYAQIRDGNLFAVYPANFCYSDLILYWTAD